MGDSRGHWEGNTLVVETTNFNSRTSGISVNGGASRHTEDMKVTERIMRVGPDQIVWKMTFDDPKTWTRPFTAGTIATGCTSTHAMKATTRCSIS